MTTDQKCILTCFHIFLQKHQQSHQGFLNCNFQSTLHKNYILLKNDRIGEQYLLLAFSMIGLKFKMFYFLKLCPNLFGSVGNYEIWKNFRPHFVSAVNVIVLWYEFPTLNSSLEKLLTCVGLVRIYHNLSQFFFYGIL